MNSLRMLATDLDGTFIGNEPEMIDLWRSLDEAGVMIVFASGRHLSSIESFYREVGTDRRAAACVTMVGTEIWHRRHGGYVLDESWEGRIAVSWDKAKVGALVAAAVPARLQPDEWQSPLKASYYLEDASEGQLAEIRAELLAHGVDAKIVYSNGRFLDLLPPLSGKGEAVRYLADVLSIAPENVVTAGDSGNDLDMIFHDPVSCFFEGDPSRRAGTGHEDLRGDVSLVIDRRQQFLSTLRERSHVGQRHG